VDATCGKGKKDRKKMKRKKKKVNIREWKYKGKKFGIKGKLGWKQGFIVVEKRKKERKKGERGQEKEK